MYMISTGICSTRVRSCILFNLVGRQLEPGSFSRFLLFFPFKINQIIYNHKKASNWEIFELLIPHDTLHNFYYVLPFLSYLSIAFCKSHFALILLYILPIPPLVSHYFPDLYLTYLTLPNVTLSNLSLSYFS